MTTDIDRNRAVDCRRALEALRNGVPNHAAVEMLGCNQPQAQSQFADLLARCADRENPPSGALGMLVSGNFGSGKSHLLTHLEHFALSEGFVCSKVAISKETPLYDLGKVFKSAADNGRMPDRNGRLIEELGQKLNPRSPSYQDFTIWADDVHTNRLSRMFSASLLVHKEVSDSALRNDIESFWGGESIKVSRIKTDGLRKIGQLQHYSFPAPKQTELPPQRLRFAIELIKAAGYKGWVVLLDEIELVGSYSILQRGRSYAELSRWMGQVTEESYPGLVTVGTVTGDFATRIIREGNDRDNIGPRLATRYERLASPAETGMRLIDYQALSLNSPNDADVQRTIEGLRHIYSDAYGWNAPPLEWKPTVAMSQNQMRHHVRAAINEWDLRRLYGDIRPEIEVDEFRHSYEEDPDLERESQDNDDAGSDA